MVESMILGTPPAAPHGGRCRSRFPGPPPKAIIPSSRPSASQAAHDLDQPFRLLGDADAFLAAGDQDRQGGPRRFRHLLAAYIRSDPRFTQDARIDQDCLQSIGGDFVPQEGGGGPFVSRVTTMTTVRFWFIDPHGRPKEPLPENRESKCRQSKTARPGQVAAVAARSSPHMGRPGAPGPPRHERAG